MNRKIYLRNNFIYYFRISTNRHFIASLDYQGQLSIYSKQQMKQIWKLKHLSFQFSFSPSDKLLAFTGRRLIVIQIGSQNQIYNECVSVNHFVDRFESINFLNETMILIASFISYKILKVDTINKQTIQIINVEFQQSTFNYDSINENILFVQKGTDLIQIWNVGNGNKVFQSPSLYDKPVEIKLIDSDNLILVRCAQYSQIYKIDYSKQELQSLELQIPEYLQEYSGPLICYDSILNIAPQAFTNPEILTIQFKIGQDIYSIAKKFHIPLQKIEIFPQNIQNQRNIAMAKNIQEENHIHFLFKRTSNK